MRMTDTKYIKTEYSLPRVAVRSHDATLIRKIELVLAREAEVSAYGKTSSYDILLIDKRARYASEGGEGTEAKEADKAVFIIDRALWREGMAALPYPFLFRELREAVSGGACAPRLTIDADGRHITLDGESIRLTESEHRLLSAIVAGGGDFVSREELVRSVFGESAEGGILNVYVHYLREKLELHGEKIILSSRRGGYRIDKKYLGGGKNA